MASQKMFKNSTEVINFWNKISHLNWMQKGTAMTPRRIDMFAALNYKRCKTPGCIKAWKWGMRELELMYIYNDVTGNTIDLTDSRINMEGYMASIAHESTHRRIKKIQDSMHPSMSDEDLMAKGALIEWLSIKLSQGTVLDEDNVDFDDMLENWDMTPDELRRHMWG